jgi:hypothetical protein
VSIHWSPRVKKSQLWRLYKSEAAGQLDVALLEEVGQTLFARCGAIVTVSEAVAGKVRCPQCMEAGRITLVQRERPEPETSMTCPHCAWSMSWGEYRRTFQRHQLNLGGAGKTFNDFLEKWPSTQSPREKMLLIDRLIHEFHYSLKNQPELPTRSVAVNLIEGKLTDVAEFLNDLAEGIDDPDLVDEYRSWQDRLRAVQKFWDHPGLREP